MPEEFTASTHLPSDPSAARLARRFLASLFDERGLGHPPFDLLLVTSELVANGVMHGTPPVVLHVDLADLADGAVRVAIGDGGAGDPVAKAFTDDLGGGRGLSIVAQLSRAWGVDTSAREGKRVWAVVPLVSVGVDGDRPMADA